MEQEKRIYIEEQCMRDYILKSQNSALGFLLVSLIFLIMHRLSGLYSVYITILTCGSLGLAICRLINAKYFLTNQLPLKNAARNVDIIAVLNAIAWASIGVLSVLAYDSITIQILVTFIVLITFSATSVVTLSHRMVPFILVSSLVQIPQFFYSIYEYEKTKDPSSFLLLIYIGINLLYSWKQAKVIKAQLTNSYATEFDLKRSLEEIETSKRNLIDESVKTFHASRLSSLGEMAGGVAHEINNPLTIIQGMTKSILVHDENEVNESVREKLKKINLASERISKIVKGMKLISSKHDQIEHEVVHVSKVVELSLGLFEEKIKNENIQFKLDNPTDPIIKCNPLQISQILVNLLSNAHDAISRVEERDKFLAIKVTEDSLNHTVDIRVINSGELISEKNKIKIFEPFFSTKSLGKGTGLGLSISQTLAHSNGGILSYEEYEGKVCFKIHLPTYLSV